MTQRSIHNNTNIPLKPFGSFTGQWEPTSTFLEISAYLNSSAYLAVSIQQSQDASAVVINTTYNYTPTDEVTLFNTGIGLPFYRIILSNEADVQVAHMALTTILTAVPSNVSATIVGDVTASITGVVDVSGNVVATNLITETLATRRVDFLVVGNWYRVASVGLTSGAEWQALSGGTACVGGQSVPDVGRLFQCVAVGSAVAGGGTCYDVEYNTNAITLADPTTVRVKDSYGDPITTTAGNLMVGINNIYTANPLHTIVDSGVVGIDSGNNLVSVNDSSTITVTSVTNALPAGTNVLGLVGLDITGGANTVAISQNGTDNVVVISGTVEVSQINNALPSGGNTIGVVGIDTALNTIKIDPANNDVKVNPTAQPPARITGLANTAISVGGPGLIYGASYQNKSSTVNCWVKLYDSVAAPTAGNTPFLIQYLEAVQLYTLSHANDNFFNAPIANTLWVRATLLPDDNDSTDTGVDAEATFFVGS